MDIDQLSKFFSGELTFKEKESLLASLDADEEQFDEAAKLKNSWVAAQLVVASGDRKKARKGWKKFRANINRQKNRQRSWQHVAVAATITGIVVVTSFFAGYFARNDEPVDVTMACHTLSVPAGQYAQLILSDGSEIWLNSRSKLIYPERFTSDIREVQFEGEGLFKVVADNERPFVVKTELMDMVATGTQFNISAYSDDSWVATALVEGVVKLHSGENGIDCEVNPGQIAVYDKEEHRISIRNTDTDMLTSWTHGEFQFKEMTLVDIAKRFERNFNVSFVFYDESLKQRVFTGTFYNHQSIETILRVIETSTRMQYRMDKDTIYILSAK